MPPSPPPPAIPSAAETPTSSSPSSPPSPTATTSAGTLQITAQSSKEGLSNPAISSEPSSSLVEEDERSGGALSVVEQGSRQPAEAEEAEGGTALTKEEEKGKGKAKEEDEAKETALDRFNCHICLDLPSQPVVTPCGHMYCWPCMHEWLVISKGRACPVCKTKLSVEQLIPIYSAAGESDPRDTPLPPRPRPAASASATSFRPPSRPSSFFGPLTAISPGFTFQAGVFPLPGMSMTYAWPPGPPVDEEEERERLGLETGVMRDPHRGGRGTPEQEWLRGVMQQAFMLLFFAVFVALTFSA